MMIDPNEVNSTGPKRRENAENSETNPARRPFCDVRYLYEIPHPRPEDPPMRDWWIVDDESGDQQRR
jgi:hypothetical protein